MSQELKTRRERWGYDQRFMRCEALDDEGNVLGVWFERVEAADSTGTSTHRFGRRRMVVLAIVFGSFFALMALRVLTQVPALV